jgi:hypothetical protein
VEFQKCRNLLTMPSSSQIALVKANIANEALPSPGLRPSTVKNGTKDQRRVKGQNVAAAKQFT